MPDDDSMYDSGPFCKHWGDPGDCEEACARCQHECRRHRYGEDCTEEGCKCPGIQRD